MRKSLYVLPLAAALALTACGGDADGDDVTADEMASQLADAETPQPGQYRSTQELLELDVPGMPEEMAGMMRSAFAEGAAEETTYCLTAEDAASSREQMLANMAESDCNVERFDMSGGTIDAAMNCPTGQGITGDVSLTGTMDGNGADMVMSFSADMPGMGPGTIRMRVVSERIGECS
ncbi:hypothetical protein GCM10009127_14340 [Alteraurantiacibacter aestuarii]|uniref:DUF3617 family protein n=1 Tax=Alteraurantiacibacter aestuarii TaxID=650004 RepID=A0A844ZJM1_9SPHN|nr:DUF3617 domain-containing protein [Alteraurantiacibacter aestuarii]MXO87978.1 DUF3617 family protein [Alteraurantiacibacter aestuarii]